MKERKTVSWVFKWKNTQKKLKIFIIMISIKIVNAISLLITKLYDQDWSTKDFALDKISP